MPRGLPLRLLRRLQRLVVNVLFGFSPLDAAWILILAFVGSRYAVFDLPLILFLVVVFFQCSSPVRPHLHHRFRVIFWVATLFLAATGVAGELLPRDHPRVMAVGLSHHLMGKYASLLIAIYAWRHVSRTPGAGAGLRLWTARFAWLALKLSVWTAALVSWLAIEGELIAFHKRTMLVAVGLVALHVVQARRVPRAQPGAEQATGESTDVELLGPRPGRVFASALPVAAGLAVASLWFPISIGGGSNLLLDPDEMRVSRNADFHPASTRTSDGAAYQPAFLAQAETCGVGSCHPIIFSSWLGSPHRHSASPEYREAVRGVAAREGPEAPRVCASCHDPISLLSGTVGAGGELVTPESRRTGISCLVCHSLEADHGAARGGYVFRAPVQIATTSLNPGTILSRLDGHAADFHRPGFGSGALCASCHHLGDRGALREPPAVRAWVNGPVHRQERMTPQCRVQSDCVGCHMPRQLRPARPGGQSPDHAFAAPDPASGSAE